MTSTQWMGAAILTAALGYWTAVALHHAAEVVRAARRDAFTDHVRTAGVTDIDWDADLARITGRQG